MLPRERGKIAVGDLICAGHQFRPQHAVRAAQVVGDEGMARVGQESAQNAKRQLGCQADNRAADARRRAQNQAEQPGRSRTRKRP